MKLTEDSKKYLNKPFNREEIKKAVFYMDKLKASGPNGFQTGFYQEYWDVVGDDTTDAILKILNNNKTIEEINETFITLISKIKKLRKCNIISTNQPLQCIL